MIGSGGLVDFFIAIFPWGITKVMVLILLFMYVVFAAVVVRQEQLMSRVVEISYSPFLRLFAVVHFLSSVILFVIALIFL